MAAHARQCALGQPRCAPGRSRAARDRRVLQLHGDELLHRRKLRERHPPDGGGDDDRLRRRLRAAPRRDRSVDRLPERYRGGDRGDVAASRRAQLPGVALHPDRSGGRRGDRRGAGNGRREDRSPVVRRDSRRAPDLARSDPEGPRAPRGDHHRVRLDQLCGDVLLLRERRLAHRGGHHRGVCTRRAERSDRPATCGSVGQPMDADREGPGRRRGVLRHGCDLQSRDEAGGLPGGHAADGELHAVARSTAGCCFSCSSSSSG